MEIKIDWKKAIENLEESVKEAGGEIITWHLGYPIIKWKK